jgi:hypothetical protein
MINVHILATHLFGEPIEGTTLVFRTLRVGFPTAKVTVWGNNLNVSSQLHVRHCCDKTCATFLQVNSTAHDRWITGLVEVSPEPFWICDTDIVFRSSIEGFKSDKDRAIFGRYEPEFVEPWSKTQKVDRLHTSLLWINPKMVRSQIRGWMASWHPNGFPFMPEVELIRQQFIPQGLGKKPLFYDTCSGLYQAIGGQAFTDEQNNAFDHLHCGTYVRRMKGAVDGLKEAHEAIYSGKVEASQIRDSQQEFYRRNHA